jgi:hypothetical protein
VQPREHRQEGRRQRHKLADTSLRIYKLAKLEKIAIPTELPRKMEYVPSKAPAHRGFPPFNLTSSHGTLGLNTY